MSKSKPLTHQQIQTIIDDYMQAYRMAYGEVMAGERAMVYRKGWFYFCPKAVAATDSLAGAVPYRAQEVEEMTAMLRKKTTQRTDSDENYYS